MAVCGCRSNSNARIDVLEAELRARDNQIGILQHELEQTRLVNQALEQEFHATPLPHPPDISGRPVAPLAVGPLKELELGRGTGGVDEDNFPGDEALMIVLIPRDHDGSEIKAAGSLSVSAYEITDQGLKLPLSTWDLTNLELRRRWKSGLFSTGYHVTLPWQRPPTTRELRVVAQFTALNGQVYETDRDVKIRPMPGTAPTIVVHPTQVAPEVIPGPELMPVPDGSEPLPLPRKLSESHKVRLLAPRSSNHPAE